MVEGDGRVARKNMVGRGKGRAAGNGKRAEGRQAAGKVEKRARDTEEHLERWKMQPEGWESGRRGQGRASGGREWKSKRKAGKGAAGRAEKQSGRVRKRSRKRERQAGMEGGSGRMGAEESGCSAAGHSPALACSR